MSDGMDPRQYDEDYDNPEKVAIRHAKALKEHIDVYGVIPSWAKEDEGREAMRLRNKTIDNWIHTHLDFPPWMKDCEEDGARRRERMNEDRHSHIPRRTHYIFQTREDRKAGKPRAVAVTALRIAEILDDAGVVTAEGHSKNYFDMIKDPSDLLDQSVNDQIRAYQKEAHELQLSQKAMETCKDRIKTLCFLTDDVLVTGQPDEEQWELIKTVINQLRQYSA